MIPSIDLDSSFVLVDAQHEGKAINTLESKEDKSLNIAKVEVNSSFLKARLLFLTALEQSLNRGWNQNQDCILPWRLLTSQEAHLPMRTNGQADVTSTFTGDILLTRMGASVN